MNDEKILPNGWAIVTVKEVTEIGSTKLVLQKTKNKWQD
jgi:hypothetical protein